MTFTDIQNEIADRLNLTSPQALTRIGRSINERYRWLASSMGFDTIERRVASADSVVGNRSMTFGPSPVNVQKLLAVWNPAFTPPFVLGQVNFDELRNQSISAGMFPQRYAIQLMGADSVTIFLDSTPTSIFPLSADVLSNVTTLSVDDVPAFSGDFHDVLIYGGMATELEKMEKYDLAEKQEGRWNERLSDLRLFQAKSSYLDIYQGRRAPATNLRSLPLV